MVSINIVRSLPTLPIYANVGVKDTFLDCSWQHLHLVYTAFRDSLSLTLSSEIPSFLVSSLVKNMASPDERERLFLLCCVKELFHRLPQFKGFVEASIFRTFVMQMCSAELLACLTSIVEETQLKDAEISLFQSAILPLHSLQDYGDYRQALFVCEAKFIMKVPNLIDSTILYLPSHWPRADPQKQPQMLKEMADLIVSFKKFVSNKALIAAFRVMGVMTASENSDVANAAMDILTHPSMEDVLRDFSELAYQRLILPLMVCSRRHWDEDIRSNANFTLQWLRRIDSLLFEENEGMMEAFKKERKEQAERIRRMWKTMSEIARATYPSILIPDLEEIN